MRVKRMRRRIVSAARALTDHLIPSANVDLIRSFIFPLQVVVTCDLLGIPSHHRDNYRCLAAQTRAAGDTERLSGKYQDAYHRMGTLIAEVLAAKQEQAGLTEAPDVAPDLLSVLVAARHNSDRLTAQELQSMTMLLIGGGQDPTIDLIANGVLALACDPAHRQLFRRHPELLPRAMEEILRCEVPVPNAVRIAAEDIDIDGTVIRHGSMIAVMLDRAHRDPRQFPQPDVFAARGRTMLIWRSVMEFTTASVLRWLACRRAWQSAP